MATGHKPEGGGPEIPDLDVGASRAPRGKPSGAAWPAAGAPAPRPSSGNVPAAKTSGAGWPAANVPAPKVSGMHARPGSGESPALATPSGPARRASGAAWPSASQQPSSARGVTITDAPVEEPPASKQGGAPGMENYFGSGNFDGDHFGGDDGFLAIETSEPLEPLRGFSSFPPPSDFGKALSSRPPASPRPPFQSSPGAGGRAEAKRAWPTGVTPPTESFQIDAAELAELGAYGAVPAFPLLAPAYTFRVLQRRAALRKIIQGLLEDFVTTERSRDKLLADLARDFRAGLPDGSPAAKFYGAVAEKEQRARDEQGALAGTSTEYQQGVAAIEAEMTEIRRALTEVRSTLASRQAAFIAAEENKNRAEAKKKRLYIELSGFVAQGEKAGGAIPPEHAGAVARLEAAIAAQKPDLQRVEQKYAETKAAFSAVRDEERRLLSQIRDSEKKRRVVEAEFEHRIGQRSAGAQAAERAMEAAFADVGRALLAAHTPMGELELNFFTALMRGDEEVAASARQVERHVRALDVYDAATYRRGIVVAGVIAVMLVVLVVAVT